MHEIKMAIPIEPVPKGRPRFRVMYRQVRTITPPKTKEFEYQVRQYFLYECKGVAFERGVPISVNIEFGMRIPVSTTKKRSKMMLDGLIRHTVKPDLDNLTKAVLDALNGIAWYDDAQVVELNVKKLYTENPFIQLDIKQIT